MKLGIYLRNMGPQSTPKLIGACARAAESAGIDNLWVADHMAIPPDDAEGSGGRYLDPLATLAYVSGITERIGIGTAVLILPYRPALATAKWIASVQELSGGRLTIGAGVGWIEAEFRALGVDRKKRGELTDETLQFLHACFGADEVKANEQRFLFLPRPARPPILVGGEPPHALRRAVRFGEGWMPNVSDPDILRPAIAELADAMRSAGKPAPEVVPLMSLDVDDTQRAVDQLQALSEVGVTGVIHAWRYENAGEFARVANTLAADIGAALK